MPGHFKLSSTVVDASPLLRIIAEKLAENKLEAVLIGNAAAALQGAPVTGS